MTRDQLIQAVATKIYDPRGASMAPPPGASGCWQTAEWVVDFVLNDVADAVGEAVADSIKARLNTTHTDR